MYAPGRERDGKQIERWLVNHKGVVMSEDQLQNGFLTVYVERIHKAIPELYNGGLSLVYVYDMDEQKNEGSYSDGIDWLDVVVSSDGKPVDKLHAIGISTQAIDAGRDYAVMVFLHEYTHTLLEKPNDHGMMFHFTLDRLIERYNQATGSSVSNDYMDLPDNRKALLSEINARSERRRCEQ